MIKILIFSILITFLTACSLEEGGIPSSNVLKTLPNIPINLDLKSFSLPVQQQFSQRVKYINLIKKQYKDKSKYGWAIGQLGKTYQAYQKTDEARDCYLNAISNDSKNIEWYYLLAHVYRTIGEFNQSEEYFNKALLIDEDNTPSKIWLADVLIEQNEYNRAEETIKSILLSHSNHPMALYYLGLINLHFEKNELAITFFQKILDMQPKAYQVHYQLGQTYSSLGKSKNADYHFAQVADDSNLRVSIQFDDPFMQSVADLRRGVQSIIKQAVKASTQGHQNIALELLQKAKIANPDRIDIVYNLALVYLKLKNSNKAKIELQQVINKHDDKVYVLMAKINTIESHYSKAILNLQKALKLKPENAYYLSELARVYSLKGGYSMAIKYYNRSLEIDPNQELIRLRLVRALLQDHDKIHLVKKILNENVFSKKFNMTKQNILTRIAIQTNYMDAEALLPSILDDKNSMNYETKAMLAAYRTDFSQAVEYQNKALSYTKKTHSKKLILSRLGLYKMRKANKVIWFPDEELISE